MRENTTVEELDKEIREKRDERRRLKLVEQQQTMLLPRLRARHEGFCQRIEELRGEAEEVAKAIQSIEAGVPTDYGKRGPRRKTAEPKAD